mmetsp:Transcript_51449/g.161713  ORF Transcript_51449/g.161713 Transcript_51449/m.161713 type:complete len:241 (-) Transcript_51449:153-875(-)
MVAPVRRPVHQAVGGAGEQRALHEEHVADVNRADLRAVTNDAVVVAAVHQLPEVHVVVVSVLGAAAVVGYDRARHVLVLVPPGAAVRSHHLQLHDHRLRSREHLGHREPCRRRRPGSALRGPRASHRRSTARLRAPRPRRGRPRPAAPSRRPLRLRPSPPGTCRGRRRRSSRGGRCGAGRRPRSEASRAAGRSRERTPAAASPRGSRTRGRPRARAGSARHPRAEGRPAAAARPSQRRSA